MPETRSRSTRASASASARSSSSRERSTAPPAVETPVHRQNGHATASSVSTSSSTDNDTSTAAAPSTAYVSPRYGPNGPCALTSVVTQAALIGFAFGLSSLLAVQLHQAGSQLWRLSAFVSICAVFHFMEFYATARWNAGMADRNSFLIIGNGVAQPAAYVVAVVEVLVREVLGGWFGWRWGGKERLGAWVDGRLPAGLSSGGLCLAMGLLLVVVGQLARSMAMREAGRSFNHLVQFYKREDHILVTSGIYRYIRHPSYFGFYYWALGTQLVLGNVFSFWGYAFVLWKFFSHRVHHEERYLISFFGDEYKKYRQVTPTWIPCVR